MKRSVSMLSILFALTLASCGGAASSTSAKGSDQAASSTQDVSADSVAPAASSSEGVKTLKVQLIPSVDPTVLQQRATALTPFLNEQMKASGYEVSISVSTDYTAAMTALADEQIDAAFLSAANYAQATIQNPGKIDVLASAARAGYKVQQDDFPGLDETARETQRKAMNGEITATGEAVTEANKADAYSYHGEQSETLAMYYSGVLFSRRDAYSVEHNYKVFDTNGDGTISIQELHDGEAVWGVMGTGSSSGYVYAYKTIYDAGFTNGFVSKTEYDAMSEEDKAKSMISVNQQNYNNAIDMLMSGQIDVSAGYFDTRYGAAWTNASSNTWYHNDSLFENTYTVAVTAPIMNDTICVRHSLESAAGDAIFNAFVAAANDHTTVIATTKTNEDGTEATVDSTPADVLYSIYSHTGYVRANDSDYDSAREMYTWLLTHSK